MRILSFVFFGIFVLFSSSCAKFEEGDFDPNAGLSSLLGLLYFENSEPWTTELTLTVKTSSGESVSYADFGAKVFYVPEGTPETEHREPSAQTNTRAYFPRGYKMEANIHSFSGISQVQLVGLGRFRIQVVSGTGTLIGEYSFETKRGMQAEALASYPLTKLSGDLDVSVKMLRQYPYLPQDRFYESILGSTSLNGNIFLVAVGGSFSNSNIEARDLSILVSKDGINFRRIALDNSAFRFLKFFGDPDMDLESSYSKVFSIPEVIFTGTEYYLLISSFDVDLSTTRSFLIKIDPDAASASIRSVSPVAGGTEIIGDHALWLGNQFVYTELFNEVSQLISNNNLLKSGSTSRLYENENSALDGTSLDWESFQSFQDGFLVRSFATDQIIYGRGINQTFYGAGITPLPTANGCQTYFSTKDRIYCIELFLELTEEWVIWEAKWNNFPSNQAGFSFTKKSNRLPLRMNQQGVFVPPRHRAGNRDLIYYPYRSGPRVYYDIYYTENGGNWQKTNLGPKLLQGALPDLFSRPNGIFEEFKGKLFYYDFTIFYHTGTIITQSSRDGLNWSGPRGIRVSD
jgi:hypothetical protein